MAIGDYAKATFWGAMLVLALLTVYFWFIAQPANILAGIVTALFTIGFGWLGFHIS